jgi:hypothetical protein
VIRDDYLLRQVRDLVALLVRAARRGPKEDEDVEARAAAILGLDLGMASLLSSGSLLMLCSGPEGLDAGRCLVLGAGLAGRARRAEATGDEAGAARAKGLARTLIAAAVAARPELLDEDVRGLLVDLADGD